MGWPALGLERGWGEMCFACWSCVLRHGVGGSAEKGMGVWGGGNVKVVLSYVVPALLLSSLIFFGFPVFLSFSDSSEPWITHRRCYLFHRQRVIPPLPIMLMSLTFHVALSSLEIEQYKHR
jgi:hypothetical protein